MNQLDRITIASRAFSFAGVLGLSATTGSTQAIQSALVIGAIAATASLTTMRANLPDSWVAVGEGLLVGLLVSATFPFSVVMLPYLAIPCLIAGIAQGVAGVAWVVLAETTGLLTIHLLSDTLSHSQDWEIVAPWIGASLGAGLLGSLLRQMGKVPDPALDESYVSAHRLLTQLRAVARKLSRGLDPVEIANQILGEVESSLGQSSAAVFVRTEGGVLVPLACTAGQAGSWVPAEDPVVLACWERMEPTHMEASSPSGDDLRCRTAFPLRVSARMIGVVVTDSREARDADKQWNLLKQLDHKSLHLDSALLFDEVRTIATVEERRRLSREIHDGIAQEVASLGYMVDDLTVTADSEKQQIRLQELRSELTRVVSELRLSIFDLRSEVTPTAGLGSALSDYVRQVGARSNLTVHLTLDEAPTRLRSEVETELLRITQEAVTNARRHSGADNLWVDCHVQPPYARVEIRDDGCGMTKGRIDSFGVRVMRERAASIGASLDIHAGKALAPRSGTVVRLTLGGDPSLEAMATSAEEEASCQKPLPRPR